MKYKIKSFILGVKEARRISCTTVHGRPARRAYNMGRKLSNGFMGLPARIKARLVERLREQQRLEGPLTQSRKVSI